MRAVFGAVMAAALAACVQVPQAGPPAGIAAEDTVFNVAPGARISIFTGAPSDSAQRDWPTFRICRTDATSGGVTVVIGPLDRDGPRHPSIRHIEVAPGSCHFVSGPAIAAVGVGVQDSIAFLSNPGGAEAAGSGVGNSSPAQLAVRLVAP